jgi:hypothetical protein
MTMRRAICFIYICVILYNNKFSFKFLVEYPNISRNAITHTILCAILHTTLQRIQLPNAYTAHSKVKWILTARNPSRFHKHYHSKARLSCRASIPCAKLCYSWYVSVARLGHIFLVQEEDHKEWRLTAGYDITTQWKGNNFFIKRYKIICTFYKERIRK